MHKPFLFLLNRYLFGALLTACSVVVQAQLYVPPGDLGLRNDLQLLADHGHLSAPMTTWPLPVQDIQRDLAKLDTATLSAPLQRAVKRLRQRLPVLNGDYQHQEHVFARVAGDREPLRGFTDWPRAKAEVGAQSVGGQARWGYQLRYTYALDAEDDREHRFDSSYLAGALGNWLFSAGWQDRWWGPGWQGSLILGNNARPVPAVMVQRQMSLPFESRWLSWIGPWTFNAFFGQLESGRVVPDAKLLGMRVSFRPLVNLEIGLSRTAQWGGQGRPQNLRSLGRLLLGQDNRGDDVTVADEPGNQLAGYDARWSFSVAKTPAALYFQLIGEDEAGLLPSRFIGQLGFETWGVLPKALGDYRLTVEYADTAVNFFESKPIFNSAYGHSIYQSGYRYYGRSLGHGLDRDARQLSVGILVNDYADRAWQAVLRYGQLDRDTLPESRFFRAEFGIRWQYARRWQVQAGAGILLQQSDDVIPSAALAVDYSL